MGYTMRIAIVHDWLYVLGGAEKVLKSMLACYPSADVFCLFDVLSDDDRAEIGFTKATTSFLQRAPSIRKHHRLYLPLMPIAIEQLDLRGYDVIISSSYAVAKGVLTGPDQLHIAYVHSPMRYAWDLQHQYLAESRLQSGIKSWLARAMLYRMRLWDTRTAHGVNAYLANSEFIARRIRKVYGRAATVIYPPVAIPAVPTIPSSNRKRFFLTASRLVPYKNMGSIVEAFRYLPNETLVVAGSGPERQRLQALAGPNVSFAGFVPDDHLRRLMRDAEAFIFAAEEDFGITPVEVQAEGTPVIGLGKGGLRETVVTTGPSPTGLFFDLPDPRLIADAVIKYINDSERFTAAACIRNAARFSETRFRTVFSHFVDREYLAFSRQISTEVADARAALDIIADPSGPGAGTLSDSPRRLKHQFEQTAL